jgi:MOSC domain-containing protein YiiM
MDEIRIGLQAALKDRRGMLFRVITGGNISCGDGIQRVPADTLISSTGGKVD